MNPIALIDEKATELKNKILNSSNIKSEEKVEIFYVSEEGNDLNDGKSPEFPWKSLSRVNSAFNKDNKTDSCVCFRRGDVFRGQLVAGSHVTYTAYGEGEKPVICGSSENGADPSKWSLADGFENVWVYDSDLIDVGSVFYNFGAGYAVKRCPDIVNGQYEYGPEALKDNEFILVIPADIAGGLNNNTAAGMKGKLYWRCDKGNPGEIYDSIEFAERLYTVLLPYHSEDITIDNLAVKYGGAHGVGGGFIDRLTVQNCEIGFIGGGIQFYRPEDKNGRRAVTRYGNGVELHSYCNGYTVKNCWVHDIYDAGITHQQGSNHSVGLLFKDVSYIGNLIENCIYSIEYFAHKSPINGATVLMENILIADNIMRNAGYGFGMQRTMLENTWNMANHINGWNRSYNLSNGKFVIKNNIFDRALHSDPDRPVKHCTSLVLVTAGSEEWIPVFSGNKYIIEKGNQLAYVGLNIADDVRVTPYVNADETVSAKTVFNDETGEIILL